MKRILMAVVGASIFLMLVSAVHSQLDMSGGVSDTATVTIRPDTWVASKVKWIDHENKIVMFENGSFIRYTSYVVDRLALTALNEGQFLSVHWVVVNPNGDYRYDRVTLSYGGGGQ